MKKKQMMSRVKNKPSSEGDDGRGDGENGGDDNHDKNQQNRVDMRRNQDLLLSILLNQKQNQPC